MRLPRSALLAFLTALALAGPAGAHATGLSKQAVATGSGGAAASDTVPATEAGLGVLERGGTAADAAVAVASTLGVTDPFVAGIGGGYFVYYDAQHPPRVHDRRSRESVGAARLQQPERARDPARGCRASCTPRATTRGSS
jgi:gamma-glutamyltranspeptidase / glutathione hydrolase